MNCKQPPSETEAYVEMQPALARAKPRVSRENIGIARIRRRLRNLEDGHKVAFRACEGSSLWQDCRALDLLGIMIDGETIEDRLARVMTNSQREVENLRNAIDRAFQEAENG